MDKDEVIIELNQVYWNRDTIDFFLPLQCMGIFACICFYFNKNTERSKMHQRTQQKVGNTNSGKTFGKNKYKTDR